MRRLIKRIKIKRSIPKTKILPFLTLPAQEKQLVKKIKKYKKEKIKVITDGKAKSMTFKSAMKAVAKSEKSYFKEDGRVYLSNYAGGDGQVSKRVDGEDPSLLDLSGDGSDVGGSGDRKTER
jgi:hypothetical protein